MPTLLLGPAVPFGFDSGLPGGEDELERSLGDIDMTADQSFIWPAHDAHWSDFASSPLDSLSTAASDWARSPGKQSVPNSSNARASSSLSPGTGSVIFTPTSPETLDLFGDVTLLDYAETSDDPSTTNSFSPSSDDYVHVARVPGQPRGGRHLNNRPPSASRSGWGHLDLSNFNFNLNQTATSQPLDTDPLSDIHAFTGVTTRSFDTGFPLRSTDNSGQMFMQNPYGPNYPFAPQQPQTHPGTSLGDTHGYRGQHHPFLGPPAASVTQPAQRHLGFPPTVPSQYGEMAPQSSGHNVSRALAGDAHCSVTRSQKGQQYYFECDRSKLPDFVHDFLPPSMTGMHQKQSIEDYVADKVVRWDKDNWLDIWLTCGYGPALQWRLYEFDPKDDEPCWQLQYLQDPTTRQQVSYRKYSPPFGLMRLDPSDETHFDGYMEQLLHPDHLWEFGWTCFEEETQVDDFQARLLQAMCELSTTTQDEELRELLRRILRMMVLTYIMGHTLTLPEHTTPAVLAAVRMSPPPHPPTLTSTHHTSPRLANRQLKFFFHLLRERVYLDLLHWQQQTLRSSPRKDATWLPAFCVTLGIAMVLEEVQRTLWIQADAKARKDAANVTRAQAETEAANACARIDERFKLLVGLFQCKYRDRKWGLGGSFGNQTPEVRDPVSRGFLAGVLGLLYEKREFVITPFSLLGEHLRSRENVPLASENQCFYTSRLVARFLLPFLGLPP
ncbi:hypothetical protein B0A55_06370 [Friedmanniomyces simplex]|uniref:Transcription factor domain-containing protein n=1 Tax=Friedmanniomyces simplex TaxID=329884 RepID=A0A4U0XDP6_9PEZI|nr:hypothetical protein B0A55_06370 [Friedmanniomyces simplex]